MEPLDQSTHYDGLMPGDIAKHAESGLDATQRAVCPACEGKCLVWNVPRWEDCATCGGKGWLLERVWYKRIPEETIPGSETFVERREQTSS